MGFLIAILLIFCYIFFGLRTANAATYDVTRYGAVGDGNTYDTQAFVHAWGDLCRDTSNPILMIPSGKSFLISCVVFNGPCNSPNIRIKLSGNITAPKSRDGWTGCDYLMVFESVDGLNIFGPGQIDGQGSIWWGEEEEQQQQHPAGDTHDHPGMLHFHNCNGLVLRGTKHINSPKIHISINDCQGVDIGNLYISAPENSPNTDGIDMTRSTHVNIHNSVIQTGDDCVAIGNGSSHINITSIMCGPGHGISIGSLGRNSEYSTVEQVLVQYCNITGTQNGVRIKTVPNGSGYARSIKFKDIHLVDVKNPIIIDQHYCNNGLRHSYCPAPPNVSAVQVSDVTYKNIYGSSASAQAITLSCSGKFNCTGIMMNKVRLTGDNLFAYCNDVQGHFVDTHPSIKCN